MQSTVFERVQSGLHASSSVYTSLPSRHTRVARPVICSLKKETKKLSKTLKQHRKRLEGVLAAGSVPAVGPALTADQQLPQLQLQAVLSEIHQLQSALNSIRALQEQQAAARKAARRMSSSGSDSDSDSDSDCEDDRDCSRPSLLRSSTAVVAAGGVQCLEVAAPVVDQELAALDICQSLPTPREYESTGRLLVCQGKACMAKGALQVLQAASHAVSASPGMEVLPCKCVGKCKQGPAIRVRRDQQPGSAVLTELSPVEVPAALDQLLG
jgi:(2Fe-2S) ferredoxin